MARCSIAGTVPACTSSLSRLSELEFSQLRAKYFKRDDGAFQAGMVAGGTWWWDPWVLDTHNEKKTKVSGSNTFIPKSSTTCNDPQLFSNSITMVIVDTTKVHHYVPLLLCIVGYRVRDQNTP